MANWAYAQGQFNERETFNYLRARENGNSTPFKRFTLSDRFGWARSGVKLLEQR